jgi:uncharacterized membrane protein
MAIQPPDSTNLDEKETGRIEAFSDGVFAIAITLLVLEVKVPTPEAAEQAGGLLIALGRQAPIYVALVASFFFILVMWLNHHRLFRVIHRSSDVLLLLNGLLLFGISVVPFPTALIAEYLLKPEQNIAVMVYAGWFFLIAIFFNLLWAYASRDNRSLSQKSDQRLARHISWQYAFGPVSYGVAVVIAYFSPLLSIAITVALAVFYMLPSETFQQLLERKANNRG